MDFETAYPLFRGEILTLSRKPFLDMDPDDIASEMTVALWKATMTYDPTTTDTPFGVYWWSVWKNRRSDLAEKYHAGKRVHPDLVPPLDPSLDRASRRPNREEVAPPPGTRGRAALLWKMLSIGNTGAESRSLAEMSKRAYYEQIQSWRTEEVREWLRPD